MRKIIKFSTILFFLISILLPVNTKAASFNFINASRTVTPSTIFTDEESEVTLNVTGSPPVNVVKPNDIILVLDKSGSMQTDNRFNSMISAAKSFVDLVDLTKHSVGIVDFSTSTSTFPLSTDANAIKGYIDQVKLGGNTNTAQALNEATNLLANHRPDAQPVIVLLTDGQANDPEAAKTAAMAAKDAGIVFYTIALLGPNENPTTSAPNLLLEDMATTAHHHHFVLGSVGLQQVYEAIVEEIGLASAYDVTITETVDPNFEIVPGSYDSNIPQPTVTGNKLVWNIEELKANTLQLHYKIRLKPGAKAGAYSTATGIITYKDYTGALRSYNVGSTGLFVKNHAPVINSIADSKSNVNGGEAVTIKGNYFLPGVKVFFNDVEVTTAKLVDSQTITLTTPAGKQGDIVVKVKNDDSQFATTNFNYWAQPVMTQITPNSGPFEGGNTVSISGKYFLNGVKVKFGDKYGKVNFVNSDNLNVVVPQASKQGAVDVVLENPDGTNTTLTNGYTYASPVVVDVQVSPDNLTMTPGESQQLAITGVLSDSTTKDITKQTDGTIYKSNAISTALVSQDGLVTIPNDAKDGLKTTILVTNNGIQKLINVTVKDTSVKLTDVVVNPMKLDLSPGNTKQLSVSAVFSDGSTKDVTLATEGTTYTSGSSLTATVDTNGLITIPSAVKYGSNTTVKVDYKGIVKVVNVNVVDPRPKVISLAVNPVNISAEPGQAIQLSVIGTLEDGNTRDVTSSIEGTKYESKATSTATVSPEGNITVSNNAIPGTNVVIAVTNNGILKNVNLTVVNPAPKLTKIDVTPLSPTIDIGKTQKLTILGTYSDGSTKDITLGSEGTIYKSNTASIATVDADGLITISASAKENDVASIVISNGSVSKIITVTVTDPSPKVTGLSVNPSSLTMAPGEQKQLIVTATLSDGSTKDISSTSQGTVYLTGGSTFTNVNSTGLVSVSNSAVDGSKAYITVSNNGFNKVIVLNVVDPTPKVQSITSNPASVTLAPGGTLQLAVTGTLTDGSTKDITLGSTGTLYSSNNKSAVTVDANGLLSAPSNATDGATASIFISNNGVGRYVNVTIVDPSIKVTNFTVTPSTLIMVTGTTKQLSVLGTFSDGSTKDITSSNDKTTYSSNTSYATVSADGLVTLSSSAKDGIVIQITVRNNGITKYVSITVTTNPNKLIALESVPTSISLKAGTSGQLTIMGTLVDGTQKDVTQSSNGTTYTSNNLSTATVNASGLVTIPSSARVGSTTNIKVICDGITLLVPVKVI